MNGSESRKSAATVGSIIPIVPITGSQLSGQLKGGVCSSLGLGLGSHLAFGVPGVGVMLEVLVGESFAGVLGGFLKAKHGVHLNEGLLNGGSHGVQCVGFVQRVARGAVVCLVERKGERGTEGHEGTTRHHHAGFQRGGFSRNRAGMGSVLFLHVVKQGPWVYQGCPPQGGGV